MNSQIQAVGDGADWIRLQSREVFRDQGTFLCDFYRVSEYRGAAAPTCRPGHPDSWRRTQQKRLKRGAVGKVMEALEPYVEAETIVGEEAPVRNGHRYLKNRLESLDYPRALAPGLPIGSGNDTCRHEILSCDCESGLYAFFGIYMDAPLKQNRMLRELAREEVSVRPLQASQQGTESASRKLRCRTDLFRLRPCGLNRVALPP